MTTQWKAILDEGVIDEFIISVVPVFIGEGIGLIPSLHRDTQLSLAFGPIIFRRRGPTAL